MGDVIAESLESHRAAASALAADPSGVRAVAALVVAALKGGGKVLVCGNGGSAADSQHFAAELVGRFLMERRGLPAIALTTDTSAITSIGNDYGYDRVFERQVEALGRPGDLLVAISTSGSSANVLKAAAMARAKGMKVAGLFGAKPGSIAAHCDACFFAPSPETPRVQELHILAIHAVCAAAERELCG